MKTLLRIIMVAVVVVMASAVPVVSHSSEFICFPFICG
jgi:hypothetical protein